jgi:hypothetical protein
MVEQTWRSEQAAAIGPAEVVDRDFHLGRLHRFAAISLEPSVCADRQKARLARHATVSAFGDCARLGLVEEARHTMALVLETALAAEARRPRPPLPSPHHGPRLQRR